MANYLVVYHGAADYSGASKMEAWMTWMGGLGAACKDAGHPATRAWTVSKDGTTEDAGANPTGGYTVLEADSMQAALEMVVTCPHVAAGGTVELCELSPAGHAMA